jgi:hypothetical protein
MKIAVSIFCLLALAATNSFSQQNDFPKLTGPYLGQKPPGNVAEPFAPEFFGSRFKSYHSGIIFSPDGKEAYWQAALNDEAGCQGIFMSILENGFWTEPMIASFSACVKGGRDDSPFIPPDGKKLFFISSRPIEEGGESSGENIWVADRIEEDWSEPKLIPLVLNSSDGNIHWRFSVDRRGNLYFGTWRFQGEEVTGDIYLSKSEDGQYVKPEKLGPEINREGHYNFCPYIAPDGGYLIFARVGATMAERGPDNLYCSFREKNGTWTEAKKLNIMGEKGNDVPVVSTDGRYLFLRHNINEFYWVDATIIEELKPDYLK